MAGLKGRKIGELCNEYGISQGQYYKWRDVCCPNNPVIFHDPQKANRMDFAAINFQLAWIIHFICSQVF